MSAKLHVNQEELRNSSQEKKTEQNPNLTHKGYISLFWPQKKEAENPKDNDMRNAFRNLGSKVP